MNAYKPESDEERRKRERREKRERWLSGVADVLGGMHRSYSYGRGVKPMELESASEKTASVSRSRRLRGREGERDRVMNYAIMLGNLKAKFDLQKLTGVYDTMRNGGYTQLKKGGTIDRDRTSINLNENMDALVPGSKIADMPTGWIFGQTARDYIKTKTGRGDSMDIQEAEEFQTSKFFCKTDFNMEEIKKEEADYANYPIPKFYNFPSVEARERILYANFLKVNKEVKDMIAEIQEFNKK